MSKNNIKINSNIKNECIELFKKMDINVKEFETRGHHVLFNYENLFIVCKSNKFELFDFIEFTDKNAAKEFFLKQRTTKNIQPTKMIRTRENEICIRTLFKNI